MNAKVEPLVTLAEVLTVENLNEAWAQVKANAGASGVDGRTVEQTAGLIREHKEEILGRIREGRYRPEAVRAVDIPKANGGTRRLGIPTVLDRLIQQAIHQKLGPLWEPEPERFNRG